MSTSKRPKRTPQKPAKSSAAKRPPAPSPTPPPAAPDLTRGGPDARVEAMRLLAEGYTASSVAQQLGVDRGTVREWRDSPEGQRELAAARKAREDSFAEAIEDSRRVLRDGAVRAAQVLVDQLDDTDPAVAASAARTLLDRVGVPRTERVEVKSDDSGEDLSRLSDEEFAEYERLAEKAKGRVG